MGTEARGFGRSRGLERGDHGLELGRVPDLVGGNVPNHVLDLGEGPGLDAGFLVEVGDEVLGHLVLTQVIQDPGETDDLVGPEAGIDAEAGQRDRQLKGMVHLVDADLDRLAPDVGRLFQNGVLVEELRLRHRIRVDDIFEADRPLVVKGDRQQADGVFAGLDGSDRLHGFSQFSTGRRLYPSCRPAV